MDHLERRKALRKWWGEHKPIRTFLKHLVAVVTFGWDFPVLTDFIKWWRSRPRVQGRIERRQAAYRYFFRLTQLSIRLPIRLVIKAVTLGKYPKRPFLWDKELWTRED